MTVVDTSVWIDHFVNPVPEVVDLLSTDRVLLHPMVLAELNLGHFADRQKSLSKMTILQKAIVVEHDEVLAMVERFRLWGLGIGWVDCHLLASARAGYCHLLTKDKALKKAWLGVRPQD
jgi:predicted nucleic acid-binding protein